MQAESSLLRSLEDGPPAAVLMVAIAAALLVAIIDGVTGPDVSFSFFYVMPVAIVAWRFLRAGAVAAATFASAIWLGIDLATGPVRPLAIPLWNTLIRGAFFVTIGVLLVGLRQALIRERDLARFDALTGLANRRTFVDVAGGELARADRTAEPVTIALIDLDEFKAINDSAGHGSGDAALRSVARTIESSVRRHDLAARLGGDEFALLVTGSGIEARAVLERICERVGWIEIAERPLGCSIGASTVTGGSLDDALAAADRALYRAKRRGKGQVEIVDAPDRAVS